MTMIIGTLISHILAGSLVAALVAANVVVVPMLRHASGTRAKAMASLHDQTDDMHGIGRLKALGVATAIHNSYDTAYYTTIGVGTPPVWFSVVIDTGSADLWIPSANNAAAKNAKYVCKASTTSFPLNIPVTTWYGIGSASGSIVSDTVRFGSLESPQHIFIQADSSSNVQPAGVDGLMGLGFSAMSWANSKVPDALVGRTSLIENCFRNKQITEAAFGIWLDGYTAWNAAPNSVVGGELALGSIAGNPARYTGNITWLDVPSRTAWWSVAWDGVTGPDGINLRPPGRNIQGIVDTGTALILVDYAVAAKLNSFIGAWTTNIRGMWGVSCNKLRASAVTFTITLQGKSFTLTSADLPTRVWPDDASTCFAPFQAKSSQDTLDQWILGDIFLRKYYSIYDYNKQGTNKQGSSKPRVGLALAIQ